MSKLLNEREMIKGEIGADGFSSFTHNNDNPLSFTPLQPPNLDTLIFKYSKV
jgi:hypothetical protein